MLLSESELQTIDKMVAELTRKLVEMGCDSVRVVATATATGGNTSIYTSGYGNWFAQVGSVDNWLREMKEMNVINGISEAVNPEPPDDGGSWKGE